MSEIKRKYISQKPIKLTRIETMNTLESNMQNKIIETNKVKEQKPIEEKNTNKQNKRTQINKIKEPKSTKEKIKNQHKKPTKKEHKSTK